MYRREFNLCAKEDRKLVLHPCLDSYFRRSELIYGHTGEKDSLFDAYDEVKKVCTDPGLVLVRTTNGWFDTYYELPKGMKKLFYLWLVNQHEGLPVEWNWPRCIQMPPKKVF